MRVSPIQSNVKSVYKTHIDAIHFRKTDEKRLHGLDEEAEQKLFTEDRVQVLKELAAKPDVYERLSSALAPSIYEHEDIKKVRGRAGGCWPRPPRFDNHSSLGCRGSCCSCSAARAKTSARRAAGTSAPRSTSCCAATPGPASPSCCSTSTTWCRAGSTRPARAPAPWV